MTAQTSEEKRPRLIAPRGACDCHIHVFGPRNRFALAENVDYRPDLADVDSYLSVRERLGIERTVVVQPSIYGTDNRCTLEAIAALHQTARGIAVVSPDVSEAEIRELHEAGIRGLRFSYTVKNAMPPDRLEDVAGRIQPFGWHFQIRSTFRDLPELAPRLSRLSVDYCLDHMSSIPPAEEAENDPAFRAMLRLVETGRCWVKLSAPYQLSRSGPPAYADMGGQARALVAAAPERMLWGTNWPHPTVTTKPDEVDLLDVLLDWIDDESTRRAILVDNPAKLYDFD